MGFSPVSGHAGGDRFSDFSGQFMYQLQYDAVEGIFGVGNRYSASLDFFDNAGVERRCNGNRLRIYKMDVKINK